MNEMARVSCDGYRAVVREDERFVSFFQSITPGGSSPAVLALLSVGGARECLLLARAHPPPRGLAFARASVELRAAT